MSALKITAGKVPCKQVAMKSACQSQPASGGMKKSHRFVPGTVTERVTPPTHPQSVARRGQGKGAVAHGESREYGEQRRYVVVLLAGYPQDQLGMMLIQQVVGPLL